MSNDLVSQLAAATKLTNVKGGRDARPDEREFGRLIGPEQPQQRNEEPMHRNASDGGSGAKPVGFAFGFGVNGRIAGDGQAALDDNGAEVAAQDPAVFEMPIGNVDAIVASEAPAEPQAPLDADGQAVGDVAPANGSVPLQAIEPEANGPVVPDAGLSDTHSEARLRGNGDDVRNLAQSVVAETTKAAIVVPRKASAPQEVRPSNGKIVRPGSAEQPLQGLNAPADHGVGKADLPAAPNPGERQIPEGSRGRSAVETQAVPSRDGAERAVLDERSPSPPDGRNAAKGSAADERLLPSLERGSAGVATTTASPIPASAHGAPPTAVVAASATTSLATAIQQNSAWTRHLTAPTISHTVSIGAGGSGNILQTLRIQLHPAELGAVDATMRIVDGSVKVSLRVENATTREALQAEAQTIQNALRTLGFRVDDVEISGGGNSSGHGMNEGPGGNGSKASSNHSDGDKKAGQFWGRTGNEESGENDRQHNGDVSVRGGVYI